MIANECVDHRRRSSEQEVVCKLDFEKSYDKVDWSFLFWVLSKKGFGG